MDNIVDIKSLMRVSNFARQINRSVAWVHSLAKEKQIDLVVIDGYHFVRVNEKSLKYLK